MSSLESATTLPETPRAEKLFHVPELLAPAGDWECAKAAVENGADAIYFGLNRFNARMRAHNFTEADLPKLMEFLHRRGVRGYVTFNTLVFANELEDAEQYLRAIIASGVDAAIVQDVGICRLIRAISPDFPIHGSTQMTVTSVAGVNFTKELGCNLVVLARECSLKEIEKIQAALTPSAEGSSNVPIQPSFPLEVFVHGALCVAYSGQCLTSESLGGRSANRGECAQACRMPYELIADDKLVPLGDRRYLLSPQDLAGLEVLPDLIRLGVSSLKVEGRLKSPEYVANITRVYRRAIDTAVQEFQAKTGIQFDQSVRREAPKDSSPDFSKVAHESRYDMEMAFSRGLYTGWFRGINNQELAHARFGKKRGVYLGSIVKVQGDAVIIKLEAPLKAGDGVVFDAGRPEEKEEGGRVYELVKRGPETILKFGRGQIDFRRVRAGDRLWKTSDPELDRKLRQTFSGDKPLFQRPIRVEIHGGAGTVLTAIARDEFGHVAQERSAMPLQKADSHPLTQDRLEEQFSRLGGTPFKLGSLTNYLEGAVILPIGELNRIRRELASQLETLKAQPKRWQMSEAQVVAESARSIIESGRTSQSAVPRLIPLVRNLDQLSAVLRFGADTIYCEFEDPKKYRVAVQQVRSMRENNGPGGLIPSIFVAPPRIFKMGEDWILKQVRSSEADGYLVRNYDHLSFFSDVRRIGDFSLNIANPFSAEYFKGRFGLERLTASYDLNVAQLEALLQSAPPEWFEITIHQHMPMFHMEHCVFCAFLSKGTDYSNCGRPCEKQHVRIRDRVGAEHPLKADAGCRNTVFNSLAQTGAEYAGRFLSLGVRNFRVEFLNETPEQVIKTLGMYHKLLNGEITGTNLWRELKLVNQLGVTRGQLERQER